MTMCTYVIAGGVTVVGLPVTVTMTVETSSMGVVYGFVTVDVLVITGVGRVVYFVLVV